MPGFCFSFVQASSFIWSSMFLHLHPQPCQAAPPCLSAPGGSSTGLFTSNLPHLRAPRRNTHKITNKTALTSQARGHRKSNELSLWAETDLRFWSGKYNIDGHKTSGGYRLRAAQVGWQRHANAGKPGSGRPADSFVATDRWYTATAASIIGHIFRWRFGCFFFFFYTLSSKIISWRKRESEDDANLPGKYDDERPHNKPR